MKNYPSLIKTSYFILSFGILLACKKEQEVFFKDYLHDDGVSFSITGNIDDNIVNENASFRLYKNYDNSRYSDYCSDFNYINARRYSNDFLSFIDIHFTMDDGGIILNKSGRIYYNFKFNNKIKDLNINSINGLKTTRYSFNPETGSLSFNFSYYFSEEDTKLTILGKANMVVFRQDNIDY